MGNSVAVGGDDVKIPTHCAACNSELHLHCGTDTCQWLKCRNPRCVWENLDIERGVRTHRDGHVESVPA